MTTPDQEQPGFVAEFPFGIDNGELDECSSQRAFVLGYEFCQCVTLIQDADETGDGYEKPIHAESRDRVQVAAEHIGVAVEFLVYHDDWLWLKINGGRQ